MSDHVGERLLDDPICGEFHRGRQRRRFSQHGNGGVQAGRLGHPSQLRQPAQARRRVPFVQVGVLAAQRPKDATQFTERLGGRLFYGIQRLFGLLRPAVDDVRRDPRLHADARNAVRDHVMHLVRDPQPLLVHQPGRLGVPLPLQLRDPLGHHLAPREVVADRLAESDGELSASRTAMTE